MNPASLRADAADNRARIIAAARAAIANADEVKLNAIAKQAGVGQGTLYRHFPTREALLAEVYREDVGELVAAAPALLAGHEPFTALARWLDRLADYAQVKRGVFGAVEAAVSQDLAVHSLGPIGEAVTLLLDFPATPTGPSAGTSTPVERHPPRRLPDPARRQTSRGMLEPGTCSRSSWTDCASAIRIIRGEAPPRARPAVPQVRWRAFGSRRH